MIYDYRFRTTSKLTPIEKEKITEINTQLKEFLENPDKEKIYLAKPELEGNLERIMNPHWARGGIEASSPSNLFIHLPRAIYSDAQGYQFIDYNNLRETSLSVINKIPLICADTFSKVEVEAFLKQAAAVVKQIKTGTQQIEREKKQRERDTQIANAMPYFIKLSKSLDLKALLACFHECITKEKFLVQPLMDICSNILPRLDDENICSNDLIDLKSPITFGFPTEPLSFPLDKYFYDARYDMEILRAHGFDPFTGKIKLIESLRSARPEYFQKALSILKTVLKETAHSGEEIIRKEFQKGAFCWDEYLANINLSIEKVRDILKTTAPFMNNPCEFSLASTQENPLKNKNTTAMIEYVSGVFERNLFDKDKSCENSPEFIQLGNQIDQVCEQIYSEQKLIESEISPEQNITEVNSYNESPTRDIVPKKLNLFQFEIPSKPLLARLETPVISDEEAKKIMEINKQLQQFLDDPEREKIYLAEPTLRENLEQIMNPHWLRWDREANSPVNLLIYFPRAFGDCFQGYKFIDFNDFMSIPLSVMNRIPEISKDTFNRVEVKEYFHQATQVIKQIKQAKQKLEFWVKEMPCLMNIENIFVDKPIDLPALLVALNNCVLKEEYFVKDMVKICKSILECLDENKIPFNKVNFFNRSPNEDFDIEKEFQELLAQFKTALKQDKSAGEIIKKEFSRQINLWYARMDQANEAIAGVRDILKVVPEILDGLEEFSVPGLTKEQKNPYRNEDPDVTIDYFYEIMGRISLYKNERSYISQVFLRYSRGESFIDNPRFMQLAKQIEHLISFPSHINEGRMNPAISGVGRRHNFFESVSRSELPLSENPPEQRPS